MNKKTIIILVVLLTLGIGGSVWAYSQSNDDQNNQQDSAMQKESLAESDNSSMEKDDPINKEDSMSNDDSVSANGSYITLADYNSDQSKYADSKKVYFFHASWCPICQSIEKEINSDVSKIPKGVTLIKTDFDSSTDLRKKYGITTQYTFVQIDNNGNQQAKWSATSLDDAIAGIN